MAGSTIPGVRNAGVILRGLTAAPVGDRLLYADSSKSLLSASIGTGLAFSGGTLSCTVTSVSDHGGLGGLSDDDHVQYLLLAGRAGGQTIKGDTASGGHLTLSSTNHAIKGRVLSDPITITIPAAADVGHRIVSHASQSGLIVSYETSGGANRMSLSSSGLLTLANDIVSSGGSVTAAGSVTCGGAAGFYINARVLISATASGKLQLRDAGVTDFAGGMLLFGAVGTSRPALKESGGTLQVRRTDDSGDADLTARTFKSASFTVATLPVAGVVNRIAFASNGRKAGEGAGSGTGVPVWDDGTNWKTFYDNSTVAA